MQTVYRGKTLERGRAISIHEIFLPLSSLKTVRGILFPLATMVETHQILVLSTLRSGTDRLLVRALSRTAGRVTLSIPLTHSQRASLRHTLFRPFALLEVSWEASPLTSIYRPRTARSTSRQDSILASPDKTAIVIFLAEFLTYATAEGDSGEQFFDYVNYAIEWLETAQSGYANFHIVFLFRLTRFLGIQPNWESQQGTGRYFDLDAAEYTDRRPAHRAFLEGEDARAVGQLARLNFATMHLLHISGQQRSHILHVLISFYRLHLPGLPTPKSLEVLETVFA